VPQPVLDAFDDLTGVALVPMPVEGLGHEAKLDDEVAGQVLRLGLAPFLLPQAEEGCLVAPMITLASEPPIKWRRSTFLRDTGESIAIFVLRFMEISLVLGYGRLFGHWVWNDPKRIITNDPFWDQIEISLHDD
jgi:hypothetical protein